MKKRVPRWTVALVIIGIGGVLWEARWADVESYAADTRAKASNPARDGTHSEKSNQTKQLKQGMDKAKRNTVASAEYHFVLAQAYASDGNPDMAIEEYKLTLMFDPKSALVQSRLAAELIKKGMLSEAMGACKEALKLDPNLTDAHLILAGLYSATHQIDLALAEYDQVLMKDPKHEEAVIYKSQVLVEDGRLEEARDVLRHHLKKSPNSALSSYYLGRVEQQMDHFKEAVAAYRKAMEEKTGFSQAALALGYLYEEKGMNPQAITIYRQLYDDTQDSAAASRLATIYLKEEKYQQALPYLHSLEMNDSDDMNVRVKLGLVHMELKQFDQAIAIFKNILQKHPDSDRIHYYLGSLYEATKKLGLAIDELKAIPLDSHLFADAAIHAAFLMKQEKRSSEAKAFIKDVIAKAPKNPSFYLFQASLEEDSKNLSSAVSILQKAVKEFPDDEKIHYYLGSLYDREGKVEKSLQEMELILKLNPQNVDALNYIGYTWTLQGVRLNDAEKMLKRAMGLRPDNGYIQDSWGWYLFTRGKVREAVVELEKAAHMKPNEATILEHLGDAYLRSNLLQKALLQYSDAAKYSEDEAAKRKIQEKLKNLEREIAGDHPSSSSTSERVPASESHE